MNTEDFKELFEQQQTRTTKQLITQTDIDNVRRIVIDDFDDEELDLIWKYHKNLLQESMLKNNSNEVGYLVDLVDWTKITIYGTEEGITLKTKPEAKKKLIEAPKNSLLFFHNHPKNRWFSEKDLDSFITSNAILMVSVVCNNGRQYFLKKEENFSKENALLYYGKIYQSTEEGAVREFLRTCRNVGLTFVYGGN